MTRGPPRIRSPDPTPQRYPEHPLRVNHLGFPGHKTQGRGEGGERAQSAEKLLPKVNLTMSQTSFWDSKGPKRAILACFTEKSAFCPVCPQIPRKSHPKPLTPKPCTPRTLPSSYFRLSLSFSHFSFLFSLNTTSFRPQTPRNLKHCSLLTQPPPRTLLLPMSLTY